MNTPLKSRRYCFTIYDYERELANFLKLAESLEKHRYICFGLETCPDTGRKHIQGYIELDQAQRLTYLQKYFNFTKEDGSLNKFHIQIANGTAEDNKKYTSKEDTFYEFGEPVTQGKRNDLREIKDALNENPKNLNGVVQEYGNNFQQIRYAESLQPYLLAERNPDFPPTVIWIFGSTGIGKTSMVYDTFEPKNICSASMYRWLGTNYSQQECFLLDDFRAGDLPFNTLLKLTDRYPFTVERKGGQIPFNSPYIIFTAPLSVYNTFKNTYEDIKQLQRRVKQINLDLIIDDHNIDLKNLDEKYLCKDVNEDNKPF